jgi:tetratricopeptide (TPR) repeat protein
VQAALEAMVALKLEPEKNAKDMELFRRYRSAGYPTLLVATADVEELDRLGDFVPAGDFLAFVDRVKAGDTFTARLANLDQSPGSFELLKPVYEGLMVRENFPEVYSRISAFQTANPDVVPDPSVPLLQDALMYQHSWLYGGAARFYRNDWEDEIPEIEVPRAGPSLMGLLEASLTAMPKTMQAELLRKARADDARTILGMMVDHDMPPDRLFSNAEFAFDNGFYDLAADLYTRWFHTVQDPHPGNLNQAAWNLFLARRDVEQAIAIARAAYALDSGPGVADTLAQLLYVTGKVNQAIEIETDAAAEAEGTAAKEYAEVVARMKAGEEMIDRPRFDSYPD